MSRTSISSRRSSLAEDFQAAAAVNRTSRSVTADESLGIVKIVMVGNAGVGKTCLMLRFCKNEFVDNTTATIGMDFFTRQIDVDLLRSHETSIVEKLTVQLWDTAGQESFQSLTSSYYRKADGIVVVYDTTNAESFADLPKWLEEIKHNAEEGVPVLIMGSKSEGEAIVSQEEAKKFAAEAGATFAVCSAKEGTGVEEAFSIIAHAAHASAEKQEEEKQAEIVSIDASKRKASKGGCC